MKTTLKVSAAALGFAVAQAFAQSAEVPKSTCEPKPTYPGAKAMKSEVEVKQFEKQMADYKECVVAYISARKAAQKANAEAENNAAKEYNETMAKIRADQEASLKEAETARKADAKDNVSRPGAPAPKN
jgi:hypothetical protein